MGLSRPTSSRGRLVQSYADDRREQVAHLRPSFGFTELGARSNLRGSAPDRSVARAVAGLSATVCHAVAGTTALLCPFGRADKVRARSDLETWTPAPTASRENC